MLPTSITAAPFAQLRPLQPASAIAKLAAAALTDADKAKLAEQALATDAIRASAKTARDEARSANKTRAQETVLRLKEEFKLIKKLWANNPKEMARQLARVAKQLKAALSDYARMSKENNERGQAAREALQAPATADTQTGTPKDAPKDPEAAKAVAAYEKTARDAATQELSSAEMEARGEFEFTREVRGLLKELREEFQKAKIKAALAAPDKDRAKIFEAADKEFKEIDKALEDMEKGVREAFPDIDARGMMRGAQA